MSETRPLPVFSPSVASASVLPVSAAGAAPGSGTVAPAGWGWLTRSPYWPVAGLIMALGAALRIRQWAFGRSFWSDELYVAHNLRERGYLNLLKPLAFSQSAPPGWLWLERLSLEHFGATERSLRLVPLVFGLALLPLVAYLGRRLMPPMAGLTALLLVAVAPFLVGYSNELKQYSAEAFCVTLLVGLALLLLRDQLTWGSGVLFWAVSLVGSTLSTLAVLVAGTLGVLIGVHALARPGRPWAQRWQAWGRFAAPAPAWAVTVLVMYVFILAPGLDDPQLKAYWLGKSIYPSRPLTDVPATFGWLAVTYRSLAAVPFAAWSAWVVVPLLAIGGVVCWRRLPAVAALILLCPLGIGLAGAAVSVYPLNGRLALYAVPACLMLASLAISPPNARHLVLCWVRWVAGVVLVVALVVPQLATDVVATVQPARAFPQGGGANVADYRTALRYLDAERRADDVVLATTVSWNAQSFYGPSADGYVVPAGPDGCSKKAVSTLLAGRSRIWLFQATSWGETANRDLIVRLGSGGAAVAERTFSGARVVRFDLTGAAPVGRDVCLVPPPNGAGVR